MWVWAFTITLGTKTFLHLDAGGNSAVLYVDNTRHFHVNWGATDSASTHQFAEQAWHHLVADNNGTTQHLYVDGVLEATAASATASALSATYIGRNATNALNFSGWITEVAVYSGVLGATKVSNHFLAQEYNGIPVYGQAGVAALNAGGFLSGTSDILQLILQSVRRTY